MANKKRGAKDRSVAIEWANDEDDADSPEDLTTEQTEWEQFRLENSNVREDTSSLSVQVHTDESKNDFVLQSQHDAPEMPTNDENTRLVDTQKGTRAIFCNVQSTPAIENPKATVHSPPVQQITLGVSASSQDGTNDSASRQAEAPLFPVDKPSHPPIYTGRRNSYDRAARPARRVALPLEANDNHADAWDRVGSISSDVVSSEDDSLYGDNESLYKPRGRSIAAHNNVGRVNSRLPYQVGPLQPYGPVYRSNPFAEPSLQHPYATPHYPEFYSQYSNPFYGLPAAPTSHRKALLPPEPAREPPAPLPAPAPAPALLDIKREDLARLSSALIFTVPVQCSYATLHSRFSTSIQHNWPEHTAESDLGHTCVQKVLSMKRFKRRNEEHSVQLLCCNGPNSDQKGPPEQMRWLHMQREYMDLSEFEDVALNAPGINGELKYVVLKLFKQIHNTCHKRVFGGSQIEPGTVLRCDGESSRSVSGNNLSVSFLCFPYMTLKQQKQHRHRMGQDYSTRSMLQILYPFESTHDRDRQPAFCRGGSKSTRSIMYIPQLWVLAIGSKFVVTCAEADIDTTRGSTVAMTGLSNKIKTIPGVLRNIKPMSMRRNGKTESSLSGAVPNGAISATARVMQTTLGSDAEENRQPSIRSPSKNADEILTEKTRHEVSSDDICQTRSEPSPSPTSPGPAEAANASTSVRFVDGHRYVPPTCEDYESDSIRDVSGNPEAYPILTLNDSPEITSVVTQNDPRAELGESRRAQASSTSILSQARDIFLSKLKSLGEPKLTAEYLSTFTLIIEGLLMIRGSFTVTESPTKLNLIASLEEKVERAKIFHSMCELERDNSYFSEHIEYREPLMRALEESHRFGHSTISQELQKLGLAAAELECLFDIDVYSDDSHGEISSIIEVETSSDVDEPKVPPLSASVASLSDNEEDNGDMNELPPFLTWTWLDTAFGDSVPVQRLAAENLYTIMEDIDRNMCQRNEVPYLCTEEAALVDLERAVSNPLTSVGSNDPSDQRDNQQPRVSTRERPRPRQRETYNNQFEDVIYAAQKTAINNAVKKLVEVTKDFVGLFIPSGYNHSVANKVWGALQTTYTNVFWDPPAVERNSRPLYLISPSGTGNVQDTGVEPLFHSFGRCADCQHGIPYRSLDAALNHLKRYHLRNTTLSGLRNWSWRWVTTESELRIKMYYKQQLRLLNICLTYLELLHNRAQKIRSGVLDNRGAESAKHLPNDLVDCFEATAIFIMQAATSAAAIKTDMYQWRYTPGIPIDDMETPNVARTLARLGELGKVAQASMTRAEKTLALSDPETDMLSVGPAGPEFLISIICQNLQKKQVLDNMDMDINELYQSCASKLQYQINHFPRKRLLRDIHSLQEELSAIKLVNEWQQDAYTGILHIFDPQSFSTALTSRVTMHPAERECLQVGLKSLQTKAVELAALELRTDKLREQLKQSVEILEEDHGKAILVFTMITTIFLPLSFVTSFFGMNMEDIRNTNRSQGFFWAIALPVTAAIVVGAVLLAYQGDKLYDVIAKAFHQWRQDSNMSDHIPRAGLLSIDQKPQPFYKQPVRLWNRVGRKT